MFAHRLVWALGFVLCGAVTACTSLLGDVPAGKLEDGGVSDGTTADGPSTQDAGDAGDVTAPEAAISEAGAQDSSSPVETGAADTGTSQTEAGTDGGESSHDAGEHDSGGGSSDAGVEAGCTNGTMQACGGSACNSAGTQTCTNGTWGPCSVQTVACVALPSGWSPYSLTAGGQCAPGFSNQQTYITSATASGDTCTCNCAGTTGDCSATAVFNGSSNPGCGGADTIAANLTLGETCITPYAEAFSPGTYYLIDDIQIGAGTAPGCSATVSTTTPSISQTTEALCTAELTCNGGVCLTSSQTVNLCVAQSGDVFCPSGFPTKTLVAQTVSDTRSCSSCTCGSTLFCTLDAVNYYSTSDCTGSGMFSVPTTCVEPSSSFTSGSIQASFTSSGSTTCNQITQPSQATGSVGLDPATTMTVCCQ